MTPVISVAIGELLLGLRYFQNPKWNRLTAVEGELLLDLPYLRNCPLTALCSHGVNFCLDYGTSETGTRGVAAHVAVNYYLD